MRSQPEWHKIYSPCPSSETRARRRIRREKGWLCIPPYSRGAVQRLPHTESELVAHLIWGMLFLSVWNMKVEPKGKPPITISVIRKSYIICLEECHLQCHTGPSLKWPLLDGPDLSGVYAIGTHHLPWILCVWILVLENFLSSFLSGYLSSLWISSNVIFKILKYFEAYFDFFVTYHRVSHLHPSPYIWWMYSSVENLWCLRSDSLPCKGPFGIKIYMESW